MRLVLWPLAPLALSLSLPLVGGCRLGFDRVAETPDATPDAMPDAPPLPTLACGAPAQFSIQLPPVGPGSGTDTPPPDPVAGLAGAATDNGYFAIAVDPSGNVHGFSYAFGSDGQLAAGAVDAPVLTGATGTVAATPIGDGVLASIVYGMPDAIGTALIPLGPDLVAHGPAQRYTAWFGSDGTMARTPAGTLAFLGATTDVAAKLIAPDGTSLGSPHTVIDSSEGPDQPTITASDTGFLVTWTAATPSPNEVHAEIFDPQLATPLVGEHTLNDGQMFDGQTPRAAYAAAMDRYLFAWWQKTSKSDEVWVSLRDGALAELHRIELTPHGKFAKIAAGKSDFLVVWQDTDTTSGLAAARVRFDASVEPLTITGNGGGALAWDVVTRAGQPALMWLEGGATATVWVDPLCN